MFNISLKPQWKTICLKVFTLAPKKPNSANRKVIKGKTFNSLWISTMKVPGEGHNLQSYSTVSVRHKGSKDLTGVNYTAVRGKFDLIGVVNRKTSRSLYGVKKIK